MRIDNLGLRNWVARKFAEKDARINELELMTADMEDKYRIGFQAGYNARKGEEHDTVLDVTLKTADQNSKLVYVITQCRVRFLEYVAIHVAKGNMDKAKSNEKMVSLCDSVLSHLEEKPDRKQDGEVFNVSTQAMEAKTDNKVYRTMAPRDGVRFTANTPNPPRGSGRMEAGRHYDADGNRVPGD